MMKECYALEKIHGTSARLSYSPAVYYGPAPEDLGRLDFYAGGGKHEHFVSLFNTTDLLNRLNEMVPEKHAIIYGEYYGGSMHKMSNTYGNAMKFVAFEVRIGGLWLSVPRAEEFVKALGLEFVYYKKIPTTIEAIDAERDAPSEQAIRNGMMASTDNAGFSPPIREGIVLRPIEEVTLNNGDRVIAKHKRQEFMETKTYKPVSEEKLKVIAEAKAIAEEWVTLERLNHILNRGVVEARIENTGTIISLMIEDILREAEGEIEDSPNARKQIAKETALLFKRQLNDKLQRM